MTGVQPASERERSAQETMEQAMDYPLDPVHASMSKGKIVCGIICLHVDDLFMTGTPAFYDKVIKYLYNNMNVKECDTSFACQSLLLHDSIASNRSENCIIHKNHRYVKLLILPSVSG